MSTSSSANDIRISVVQESDEQRILDFLRMHYYPEEPITIGTEPKQQDEKDEEFLMTTLEHDACLMAVDQQSNAIVGAVLSAPKDSEQADFLLQAAGVMPSMGATKWGIALKFLARVEQEANVCQRYGVEKVLHVHAIAVDANRRGQDIGSHMMNELKALGKQLNYELLTINCTSYYAAKICERLGWECVNTASYKDYVDEDQKQIIHAEPPNDCCKTYAVKL